MRDEFEPMTPKLGLMPVPKRCITDKDKLLLTLSESVPASQSQLKSSRNLKKPCPSKLSRAIHTRVA